MYLTWRTFGFGAPLPPPTTTLSTGFQKIAAGRAGRASSLPPDPPGGRCAGRSRPAPPPLPRPKRAPPWRLAPILFGQGGPGVAVGSESRARPAFAPPAIASFVPAAICAVPVFVPPIGQCLQQRALSDFCCAGGPQFFSPMKAHRGATTGHWKLSSVLRNDEMFSKTERNYHPCL